MTEFVVQKSYLKMIQRTSSMVVFYFVFFLSLLYLAVVFLMERSTPNYILVFLAMGILYYFKTKAQVYSRIIKSSKGSAIIFDGDTIVYRKMSGEEKRFLKDECKIFRITRKYINRKNKTIVLKTKNKFYFIGPLENEESFFKYVTDHNIAMKTEEKSSKFEMILLLSALIILLNQFIKLSPLVEGGSYFLFIACQSILIYRLCTSYYAKHFIIGKELAGLQRQVAPAFLLWFLCIGLACLPLTQRDSSLDELHAVLDRIHFEKDSKKKEQWIYKFKDQYAKFRTTYPDDKALESMSNRFRDVFKREMASEKKTP